MGRRVGWFGVAVAVGLATTISACTTSAAPPVESSSTTAASSSSTTPTTSGSSTASGSATTASGIPDAAKANTQDGATAFVIYFAQVANEAYTKLEPKPIEDLSETTCKTCQGMVDAINDWKAKKQKYEGQFINPTSSSIASFPNDGTAKVLVTTQTKGGRIVDQNGSTVSTFPAESGNLSISVLRVNDQWSVSTIQAAA